MSADLLVHLMTFGDRQVPGYTSVAALDRLDWLIRTFDVRSVIEVGSFVGLSACYFASRVDSVTCVDHFDPAASKTMNPVGIHVVDDQYRAFLENTLHYPNIRSIRMPSLAAAELPIVADMVYIDAGHTYDEVVADIGAWRPHARKVICGDDNGDRRFGVTGALRHHGIADSGERIWWQAS